LPFRYFSPPLRNKKTAKLFIEISESFTVAFDSITFTPCFLIGLSLTFFQGLSIYILIAYSYERFCFETEPYFICSKGLFLL